MTDRTRVSGMERILPKSTPNMRTASRRSCKIFCAPIRKNFRTFDPTSRRTNLIEPITHAQPRAVSKARQVVSIPRGCQRVCVAQSRSNKAHCRAVDRVVVSGCKPKSRRSTSVVQRGLPRLELENEWFEWERTHSPRVLSQAPQAPRRVGAHARRVPRAVPRHLRTERQAPCARRL